MKRIKYAIYGAGLRGQRIFQVLGSERIELFIDNDIKKQKLLLHGKKVISYKEYKETNYNCVLIISMVFSQQVISELIQDKNYLFLDSAQAPQEIIGHGNRKILENLPFVYDEKLPSIIYGFSLMGLLLYEKIVLKGSKNVYFIPHQAETEERKQAFSELLGIQCRHKFESDEAANVFLTMKLEQYMNIQNSLYKIYNCYDFSLQLPEYLHPELKLLRDAFIDKRCFIIGNGPSLSVQDVNKIYCNQDLSFATNNIFPIFDKTSWRPDFYCVSDAPMAEELESKINSSNFMYTFITDEKKMKRQDNVYPFHYLVETSFIDDREMFSSNIENGVYGGGSITYICLEMAIYLGFKQIYLLGVDFTGGTKGNHFYEKETVYTGIFPRDLCIKSYIIAKKYAEERGIEIYNATRGGKLDIFTRVDFDKLFTK